jgi:hypothetical protein
MAFTMCALVVTTLDLWLVSRVVTYTVMVENPPIKHLSESPLRKILGAAGGTARVFAPFPNLGTVLDASATPVYLTFGPAAYDDPKLTMPTRNIADQVAWARRAGVTHVLSDKAPDDLGWPARLVWSGYDPFFNPAMARYREPLYLYKLEGSRGRIAWEQPGESQAVKITDFRSDRVTAQADSRSGGRLILTDLMYPGWTVTVDGALAEALTLEGMFRGVDIPAGSHIVVWSYRPWSVTWGLAVSVATILIIAGVAHIRYWHPQRLAFLDPAPPLRPPRDS